MSSLASISRAVTALRTSQQALTTSSHNLANVHTDGYSRQQVIMGDSNYSKVGFNGTTMFQVGLGVDVQAVRQVRDQFLDMAYREENGRNGFYNAQSQSVEEIEVVLGEIEGESFSEVLNDLWVSLNELSKHPDGLETRGTFIQNAALFVDRSNLISEQLQGYQNQLNTEIVEKVDRINAIGEEIYALNEVISANEIGGANANDHRDTRNNLLDELSGIIEITYKEDQAGNVIVRAENADFVSSIGVNEMQLEAAEDYSLLVSPIWKNGQIPVFDFNHEVSPAKDNDKGYLKGLLLSRGTKDADYRDMQDPIYYEKYIEPSIIMKAQAQFDQLIHGVVTLINDTLAPNTAPPGSVLDSANAPYGLDGSQGTEIFSRATLERYDSLGNTIEEDFSDPYTLYSAGNIKINPDVLNDYNKIALSPNSGENGSNVIVEDILEAWQSPFAGLEPTSTSVVNFNEYYEGFVTDIGNSGSSVTNIMENQELMLNQINGQRAQLSAVSSDEELASVIKYQHAYNAAAKVVQTIDSMLEQLVMNTGLVGR